MKAKVKHHTLAKTGYAKPPLSGGGTTKVLPFRGTKSLEKYHVRLSTLQALRAMRYWPYA